MPSVAVRTYDYEYPESEMDERESLYFDTISLADSEAAAAHRKSMSQSRNTIYHSAVDLAENEGRNSLRLGAAEHAALAWQPGYRQSTALEHLRETGGGGDHTDAAITAQILALQNGRGHLPTGIGVGGGPGRNAAGGADAGCGDDEVSRRLLRNSSTISNKDKKLPITYSQWKSRVNNKSNITIRFKTQIKFKLHSTMTTSHLETETAFALLPLLLSFVLAPRTSSLLRGSCCSILPHLSPIYHWFTSTPHHRSHLHHRQSSFVNFISRLWAVISLCFSKCSKYFGLRIKLHRLLK